eukprot:gene22960-27940_t
MMFSANNPYNLLYHLDCRWADASVTRAVNNMIREALKDAENKYFLVISESCIPLMPFTTWYRNMMQHLSLSIVNACKSDCKEMECEARWRPSLEKIDRMEKYTYWRKSASWLALNRKHATILAEDTQFIAAFNDVMACDEHYTVTLLAYNGVENETTCSDGFAHAFWPNDVAAHPVAYTLEDIGDYQAPKMPVAPSDGKHSDTYKAQLKEYNKHRNFISHIRNTNSNTGIFNGRCAYYDMHGTAANSNAADAEEPPCHYTGRKFYDYTALYLLMHVAQDIFQDELHNLKITPEEVYTFIHRKLKYNPLDSHIYYQQEHELIYLPHHDMVHFSMAQVHTIPNITRDDYHIFRKNDAYMILHNQPFLYKLQHNNAVWYVNDYVRSMIPDYDTFLSRGWNPGMIRTMTHDQVRFIPVAPMMKSVHRVRRLSEGLGLLRGAGASSDSSSAKPSPWPWEVNGHNFTHLHNPQQRDRIAEEGAFGSIVLA